MTAPSSSRRASSLDERTSQNKPVKGHTRRSNWSDGEGAGALKGEGLNISPSYDPRDLPLGTDLEINAAGIIGEEVEEDRRGVNKATEPR